MALPAQVVGIEVMLVQRLAGRHPEQGIGVVGNQHFPLADQFPLVTIQGTEESLHLVEIVGPG
ncbi:hypothetical protein D3C77_764040 [compost metagenome]